MATALVLTHYYDRHSSNYSDNNRFGSAFGISSLSGLSKDTYLKRLLHLSEKCNITDVTSWFDFKQNKMKMNFVLSDQLKLEFKKHSGNDFPTCMPSYAKPIDLNQFNPANIVDTVDTFIQIGGNQLTREIFDVFVENIIGNRKNKYKFFESDLVTNADTDVNVDFGYYSDDDYEPDEIVVGNNCYKNNTGQCKINAHVITHNLMKYFYDCSNKFINCSYLYSDSYSMYVIEYSDHFSLIVNTNKHDTINIIVEKSEGKMVSAKIINLKGTIKFLYNVDNAYSASIQFHNDKINYYDNPDNFSEGDDEEYEMAMSCMDEHYNAIINIQKNMTDCELTQLIVTINPYAEYCEIYNITKRDLHENPLFCIKLSNENNIVSYLKKTSFNIIATTKSAHDDKIIYNLQFHYKNHKNNAIKLEKFVIGNSVMINIINRTGFKNAINAMPNADEVGQAVAMPDPGYNGNFFAMSTMPTIPTIPTMSATNTIRQIQIFSYNNMMLPSTKTKDIMQMCFSPTEFFKKCKLISTLDLPSELSELKNNSLIHLYNEFLRISTHSADGLREISFEVKEQFSEAKLVSENIKNISSESVTIENVIISYGIKISSEWRCTFVTDMNGLTITQNALNATINPKELTNFYAKYVKDHYCKLNNFNKTKNSLKKNRIKAYKEKVYICVSSFDSINIYSNWQEYKLVNKNDNFYHSPVMKDNKNIAKLEKDLFSIVNKQLTYEEINKIFMDNMMNDHTLITTIEIPKNLINKNKPIHVKNNNLWIGKTIIKSNVEMYGPNDTLLEIIEDVNEDDSTFSIDEYNIGFITENFVFVKRYDRSNPNIITIHDLNKLEEKKRKEFDKLQSCHMLSKATELGQFDFVKETGLQKEYAYHMNIYMIHHDLVLQDANNFIIVCGFGDFANWVGGLFSSTNTVNHKSTNEGSNSRVTHNGKEVFKKEGGVIVANAMKIGKIEDFPQTVWKVAHIQGTTTYCIVKMVLPEDTIFIRPYSAQNWNGQLYMGKSRCDKAVIVSIQEYSFENEVELPEGTVAVSSHSTTESKLAYRVGDLVFPDKFDESNKECSHGIHVFEERHHIVSLTGDEEVKPIEIIKKIMPREINMLVSLAALGIEAVEKKKSHHGDIWDETKEDEIEMVRSNSLLKACTTNPIIDSYCAEYGMIVDSTPKQKTD